MKYFITPTQLKQNNVLNANVEDEYIEPALKEAQQIYLKEILGDAMYNAVEQQVDAPDADYQVLLEDYIQPYLEMAVLSALVVPISMKIRNMGVVTQYGQEASTSQLKDVKYLEEFYRGKAEFYANRLTKYLQQNHTIFTEYKYDADNITNPTSPTAGTIYLGGTSRKVCNKTSKGSQPTGTKDYNELINKPSINGQVLQGDITINGGELFDIRTRTQSERKTMYNYITSNKSLPNGYQFVYSTNGRDPKVYYPIEYVAIHNDGQLMFRVRTLNKNGADYRALSFYIGADGLLRQEYAGLEEKVINNQTVTIKQGGVVKGTFKTNQDTPAEIDLDSGNGLTVFNLTTATQEERARLYADIKGGNHSYSVVYQTGVITYGTMNMQINVNSIFWDYRYVCRDNASGKYVEVDRVELASDGTLSTMQARTNVPTSYTELSNRPQPISLTITDNQGNNHTYSLLRNE